jgi:hypothetical protein
VSKGQTIFQIEPDESVEQESEETLRTRARRVTLALL